MTVAQLIAELQKLDPDMPVYHQSRGGVIDEVFEVKEEEPDAYIKERYAYIP